MISIGSHWLLIEDLYVKIALLSQMPSIKHIRKVFMLKKTLKNWAFSKREKDSLGLLLYPVFDHDHDLDHHHHNHHNHHGGVKA